MTALNDRSFARDLMNIGYSEADTEYLILVGYYGDWSADWVVANADNILHLRNDYALTPSDCADTLQDTGDMDYPDYE